MARKIWLDSREGLKGLSSKDSMGSRRIVCKTCFRMTSSSYRRSWSLSNLLSQTRVMIHEACFGCGMITKGHRVHWNSKRSDMINVERQSCCCSNGPTRWVRVNLNYFKFGGAWLLWTVISIVLLLHVYLRVYIQTRMHVNITFWFIVLADHCGSNIWALLSKASCRSEHKRTIAGLTRTIATCFIHVSIVSNSNSGAFSFEIHTPNYLPTPSPCPLDHFPQLTHSGHWQNTTSIT